jgi:hypothetical protein
MVLASDQREYLVCENLETEMGRMTNKIRQSGRFAWAHWGGSLGPVFASFIEPLLVEPETVQDRHIKGILSKCAVDAYEFGIRNPTGNTVPSYIVFACGNTRKIYEVTISDPAIIREFGEDCACITGFAANVASFLPKHFYSESMSVEQLSRLATYSIVQASKIDSKFIGGLDLTIYRDDSKVWEFQEDKQALKDAASQLEADLSKVFGCALNRTTV